MSKVKKTGKCTVHKYHWPAPLRTVQHHIYPQEWGGPTVSSNLVEVCDTGHYNIHAILTLMVAGTPLDKNLGTKKEYALAKQGYDTWVLNGKPTLHKALNDIAFGRLVGMA